MVWCNMIEHDKTECVTWYDIRYAMRGGGLNEIKWNDIKWTRNGNKMKKK